MKHLLSPLLVLLLLALLGAADARFVAQSSEEWSASLESSAALARAEDWEGARDALTSLEHSWEARQTLLHILLGHDVLDDITLRLTALRCCAAAEDGEEYCALAAELATVLCALREAEALSVRNIL